jgi:DNA-directed RNA polymerase specialized sigma24 family protein
MSLNNVIAKNYGKWLRFSVKVCGDIQDAEDNLHNILTRILENDTLPCPPDDLPAYVMAAITNEFTSTTRTDKPDRLTGDPHDDSDTPEQHDLETYAHLFDEFDRTLLSAMQSPEFDARECALACGLSVSYLYVRKSYIINTIRNVHRTDSHIQRKAIHL